MRASMQFALVELDRQRVGRFEHRLEAALAKNGLVANASASYANVIVCHRAMLFLVEPASRRICLPGVLPPSGEAGVAEACSPAF
jgi:hypothetical protein